MKRYLLASFVGAILVFGWQAVAHMFLPHHDAAYRTIPNQENVINQLSAAIREEGQYMVPMHDIDASAEEQQRYMDSMTGKPWALITYHPAMENEMGMSALRSFFTALLSVLLFIYIIGNSRQSFGSIFTKSLAFGFVMFLFVWYNQNIWMNTPWDVIQGELIDLLVAWGLCGLWLGWYLSRNNRVTNR